eukprot:CAMPEP_0197909542 /NCGR_PEP_ID=MMETSP1439-20131203/69093_1 /TAXON_ID=66791 /ORGANISM="Gonyaulax spinifera, Strain CCMP409" /LENGTH=35 /DNA_ID= /DNA_START= /DNA_END= /DNA_ORIENTATION=
MARLRSPERPDAQAMARGLPPFRRHGASVRARRCG